jgi:hypothetical protein
MSQTMPFPKKFKPLLESHPAETPDYVWMVYAVCGVEPESCGWHGWVLEGAYRATGAQHATGTGDQLVDSDSDLRCPSCGRALFRTDAAVRFDRSPQQAPVHGTPGTDYEVKPLSYSDDDTERES